MSNGVYGEDLVRVGVTRKSQSTNVLLVHSELGKVSGKSPNSYNLVREADQFD